jgi:hypothetical protein
MKHAGISSSLIIKKKLKSSASTTTKVINENEERALLRVYHFLEEDERILKLSIVVKFDKNL